MLRRRITSMRRPSSKWANPWRRGTRKYLMISRACCRWPSIRRCFRSRRRLRMMTRRASWTKWAQAWTLSRTNIQKWSKSSLWRCHPCSWRNYSRRKLSKIGRLIWEIIRQLLTMARIRRGIIRRPARWWKACRCPRRPGATRIIWTRRWGSVLGFRIWRLSLLMFSRIKWI